MSTRFLLPVALVALVIAVGCTDDEVGPMVEPLDFVEGDGNPYDQNNPGVYRAPGKGDLEAYEVPDGLPVLASPEIVVSLGGLTVELIDEETGFHKVYPTGVGQIGSSGRSWTPTGEFTTGPDTDHNWYYYARRYDPEYFGGLPFLRITAENSRGYHTYGFHGPITDTLIRDYVSHGCMRMQAEDIVELFWMVRDHAETPVTIQQDVRVDEDDEPLQLTTHEHDPVALHQALLGFCDAPDEDVEGPGPLSQGIQELTFCGGSQAFGFDVEPGRVVEVTAKSMVAVHVELTMGDMTAAGDTTSEGGVTTLTLDAAGDTARLQLSGEPGPVTLLVDVQ